MSVDLTDYAKWEARREYPSLSGVGNVTQAPFANGILHLAEELHREDVIESGREALLDYICGDGYDSHNRAAIGLNVALAAMLAKIAEGATS